MITYLYKKRYGKVRDILLEINSIINIRTVCKINVKNMLWD